MVKGFTMWWWGIEPMTHICKENALKLSNTSPWSEENESIQVILGVFPQIELCREESHENMAE